MKKIILALIAISITFAFTGCTGRVSPSVASTLAQMYETTETFYVKGQEIIVINADLLDKETMDKLKQVDKTAKFIDATKNILTSEELNRYEKLEKESDEIQKYFDSHKPDAWSSKLINRQEIIMDILSNYDMAVINRSRKTLEVINR